MKPAEFLFQHGDLPLGLDFGHGEVLDDLGLQDILHRRRVAAGSRPADLREPGFGLAALGLGVDDGEVQGADLLGDHAVVVADEHLRSLAVIGDFFSSL